MKLSKIAKQLNEDIKKYDSFLVLPHIMADGDTIGCCIAMARYITSRGKKALMLLEEKIPYIYSFMEDSCDMEVYVHDKEYNFDVCIVLDTADINRLGRRKSLLENKVSYNIDHHKTNDGYAIFNFINSDVSSVGEIMYDLFGNMKATLDHDIAQAIYVAIATDTGGFRYQNTNKNCFIISAQLMDYGINVEKISEWVFERTSMNKLYLYKNTIKNIKLFFNNKVAISTLKREEYIHLDVADEDFEGLVNVVKNIEGVEIGVFLRERNSEREVKGSLRSNTDDIDVSVIAKAFGGGGHARAAGLSAYMTLDQVYDGIIQKLNEVYRCTE